MISVRLMGGLGNQLFQYAFGRQMAHRLGSAVQLDLRWFDGKYPGTTVRVYELGRYPIKADLARPKTLPAYPPRWIDKMLWSRFSGWSVYERHQPGFNANAAVPRDRTLYVGYWQSERYFPDVAHEIRKELTPFNPPAGQNADYARAIGSCAAISLHVRRGDYANNARTNSVHGLCSLEYYRAAITYSQDRVSDARFFVFSDDLDWCRVNLPLGANAVFVGGNGEVHAFEDLRLMSLCSHHIIANSSFSWWGAWLNPNPNKIVVAPRRWFADSSLDATDVVPDQWQRL